MPPPHPPPIQEDDDDHHHLTRHHHMHVVDDSSYLRTIPEDRSDAGESSSSAAAARASASRILAFPPLSSALPPLSQNENDDANNSIDPNNDTNSSTAGIDHNRRPESVISDSGALVAGNITETDEEEGESDGLHRPSHKGRRRRAGGAPIPGSSIHATVASAGNTRILSASQQQQLQQSSRGASSRRTWAAARSFLTLEPAGWTRQTKILVGLALVCVLALILTVVLVVEYAPKNPKSNNPATSQQLTPSMAPSASMSPTPVSALSPTAALPAAEAAASIDSVLYRISSAEELQNESTPEYKARQWMLNDDLLQTDVIMAGDARIAQRYVITTFFFALWDPTNYTSPPASIASVGNASFSTPANLNKAVASTSTNFTQFPIPSPVHADSWECDWYGIRCDTETSDVIKISLSDVSLQGNVPYELHNLTALRRITLANNAITGTIPNSWYGNNVDGTPIFSQLQTLDLSNNLMTGTIPFLVWTLPQLRYLYLNNNRFSGRLQEAYTSWAMVSLLEEIWLHNNSLTGPLLNAWASVSQLQLLRCANNAFTGTIPSNMASLQNLTYLDLSFNQLGGNVHSLLGWDSSVGNSSFLGTGPGPNLKFLYFNNNHLNGTLPSTAFPPNHPSLHVALTQVWLQANDFTGTLPSGFATQWTQLTDLRLESNAIAGVIDATDCHSWPDLKILQADCKNATFVNGTVTRPEITCVCNCTCF